MTAMVKLGFSVAIKSQAAFSANVFDARVGFVNLVYDYFVALRMAGQALKTYLCIHLKDFLRPLPL